MLDAIAPIAVLALVVYVWLIQPAKWFYGQRKDRHLPDAWIW